MCVHKKMMSKKKLLQFTELYQESFLKMFVVEDIIEIILVFSYLNQGIPHVPWFYMLIGVNYNIFPHA